MNFPEMDMLNRAFHLAHFILADREAAFRATTDALAKIEVAATAQDKRLYYTPAGRAAAEQPRAQKVRTKVYMNEIHLLQRLIYAESEIHEKQQEQSAGTGLNDDDMVIRFIKHLVKITIKRNSFYVTLGLSRLLHSYSTAETMQIYGLVVQDPERVRDDYYYRSRKKQLMEELLQRFGGLLKTFRINRGEERFQPAEAVGDRGDLVAKCLSMFTPWDTSCVVPAKIDPTSDELPRLSFKGSDPDKEHPIEVNRMHSVLHPDCFRRLVESFKYEPPERRLAIPRFFLSRTEGSGDQPPQDRNRPPNLSEADLSAIRLDLSRQAGRRRALSAGLLSISVDGDERARLDLRAARTASFEVDEAAEFVEVHGCDGQGETLLALLPLSSRSASVEGVIRSDVTLEAGQKLSFVVSPSPEDEVISSAVVDFSYQETNPVRAAVLLVRTMLYRTGSLIAAQRRVSLRTLKPALTLAVLAITLGGIYVVSRVGRDQRPEVVRNSPTRTEPDVEPTPAATLLKPVQPSRKPGIGQAQKPKGPISAGGGLRSSANPIVGVSLGSVKSVYVDPLGSGQAAVEFRELLVGRLRVAGKLSVSDKRDDADAVFKGTVKSLQNKIEVVLSLVNAEGETVWSTSSPESRTRFQGQPAEVAARVVSGLTAEMQKLEKGGSTGSKPEGGR